MWDEAKLEAAIAQMRASVGEYLKPEQPDEDLEEYEARECIGEVLGFHLLNIQECRSEPFSRPLAAITGPLFGDQS